ncbi:hypothetical protein [Pelomonas sp. SE-A7]|nr:hypothetical protein [Pelomonas sp. SE-A7]MDM4765458.1 hypothetical protein [Pelomonas sp. SE-A7]
MPAKPGQVRKEPDNGAVYPAGKPAIIATKEKPGQLALPGLPS